MNLLLPIAAILTVASAGRIYNNQPATAGYGQAQGILSTEPQTFTAQPHGIAIQQQLTARSQHVQQPYATQLQAYPAQNQGYADQRGHQGENGARILRYQAENDGHNYMYAYETENGIRAEEAGTTQGKGVQAQGGYSYTGDDGQVYTVTYTADENGFRAQGAHLPTPPPIPEAIAKAIEQNAQDEANGFTDDGKYVAEQQQPSQELRQHQAPRYQAQRHQAQQYQVQQHHTQQFQVQQPQHYQVQQPQQQYQVQHVQLQPQVQYHQQTQQQAPQVQYQYEDYQQNYQVSPTPVQGHSYQ